MLLKKFLKIVWKDLKTFALQKTSVLIILIISLTATSYAFSFFISNSMHMARIINEYRNPSTKYYIGNKQGIKKEEIEELQKWLEEKKIQSTFINLYSDIEMEDDNIKNTTIEENQTFDGDNVSGNLTLSSETHTSYNIIVGSNNNQSKRVSFVGKTISKEDIENKSNYIMIEYIDKNAHDTPFIINQEIEIRGKKYIVKAIDRIDITDNIIKYSNIEDYKNIQSITPVMIPISTFIENYNIYAMDLKISDNITTSDKNMLVQFLKENFKGSEIQEPIRTEDVNIEDVSQNILLFTLLIILALINIIALFTYWIDKNWRTYMIYRICGASSKSIFIIIIMEAILIALLAIIIGITIYYITTPLLNSIYINYILDIKEMFLIQGIILLVVLLNTSLKAVKISKVNPKYIERRG